ncbi:MAG TPA: acryloyl-CoA reductase [Kofleriaceae bacterium]
MTASSGAASPAAFRAFLTTQTDGQFAAAVRELGPGDLPAGPVLVRVGYSAMNYKDALVCTNNGKIAQACPLVPGLELTGEVVESSDPAFRVGDRVISLDFGQRLGISQHGGYSAYARVPGDAIVALPAELGYREALVLSGGVAALMAIRELEHAGLTPARGPVLVTGATGGVGSLAIALLARRGYTVAASTGKPDAESYLRQLGASEILSRAETSAESTRPLEAERWAGSLDSVGGATLAYLMRTTKKAGAIAAIGVAGGPAFHSTVFPLILRGIKLLGIDMPSTPLPARGQWWAQIQEETGVLDLAASIIHEVALDDVPGAAKAMLRGQTRGRTLVRVAEPGA